MRKAGVRAMGGVRRLGFRDYKGHFGRNYAFVRMMASEIAPVGAVLDIDLDLDELATFWRYLHLPSLP